MRRNLQKGPPNRTPSTRLAWARAACSAFSHHQPPTSYVEVMQAGKEAFNRFFHKMLDAGVHLAPSAYEAGFVSAAHTQSVIDETLAAAERAMQSI